MRIPGRDFSPAIPSRYLVRRDGTVDPVTLESVVAAYLTEYVSSRTESERESIVKSLIQIDKGGRIISSLSDIPEYEKSPLDIDLVDTVREPRTHVDKEGTALWILYTYQQNGGRVYRYKVRFFNGKELGYPVDKLELGSNIGDATYLR